MAIITPTRNTRAEDFDLLEEFWQSLGSVVVRMSPEEHDRALAVTSHLPHVVAAALAAAVPGAVLPLCGHGHVRTTRLAGGDPELWRQILLHNRHNVLTALEQYGAKLSALARRPARPQRGRIERLPHHCEEEPRCFGKLTSIRPTGQPDLLGRDVAAAAAELGLADRSGQSPPPAAI